MGNIQRLMMEDQKRKKMEKMYGKLPVIPSKTEIVIKQFDERTKDKKVAQQNKNNNQQSSMYSIQPSIKPFIKRSLEPERKKMIQRKRKRNNPEKLSNEKTLPFMKRLAVWGGSTFN